MKYAYAALFALGFVVVVGIICGLGSGAFRTSLGNPAVARGMITLIVAVLAGTVMLLMGIAIFFIDKSELERLAPAKDLLAVIAGLLGTIIGYYFGSGTTALQAGGASPQASYQLVQRLGKTGAILLTATGPGAPYRIELALQRGTPLGDADPNDPERVVVALRNDLPCPAGYALSVYGTDGGMAGTSAITLTAKDLAAAGWTRCKGAGR